MAKKAIKGENYFKIKEFKETLEDIKFSDVVYVARKRGRKWYVLGIEFDAEHGVGHIVMDKEHGVNETLAVALVDELNTRLRKKLPLSARSLKFIKPSEVKKDEND